MVFIAFRRRLYKSWFLFLDDLAVATGRPSCLPPGPSRAADVVETLRAATPGEKGAACRTRSSGAGSCHFPLAHCDAYMDLSHSLSTRSGSTSSWVSPRCEKMKEKVRCLLLPSMKYVYMHIRDANAKPKRVSIRRRRQRRRERGRFGCRFSQRLDRQRSTARRCDVMHCLIMSPLSRL